MACLPDGRDGCAFQDAGCGAGVRLEARPVRTALCTLPEDTRDRRWPTSASHSGLRRSGPPPMSPHSAPCDGVCGARVGAGHGESIAAGTDSGAGVHGDGIDVGAEDRRPHWVGRKMVMREAMAHRRGGGPTEYGGQPMAGAGARRTALRHVPTALQARIGERVGGMRFSSRCSSGLPSHLRAWPCARADRPRRGAPREVGEGVQSGGSTAGMPRRVELKKKGGLRCEGRPELRYCGRVSRPLSRRTLRRQP